MIRITNNTSIAPARPAESRKLMYVGSSTVTANLSAGESSKKKIATATVLDQKLRTL
jgi:hypothetical protein